MSQDITSRMRLGWNYSAVFNRRTGESLIGDGPAYYGTAREAYEDIRAFRRMLGGPGTHATVALYRHDDLIMTGEEDICNFLSDIIEWGSADCPSTQSDDTGHAEDYPEAHEWYRT